MALSFSEKRTLQKTVATNLAALAAGNVSFTDKRRLQKEITDAMAKLNAKVDVAPAPATMADFNAVLPLLKQFIGRSQLAAVQAGMRGEEAQFFIDKMLELAKVIQGMPHTYQTDGQGDNALAYLHYFTGGSDWYITEKDKGSPDDAPEDAQSQAFGYSILNGDKQNAESGYISIPELLSVGAELDFYWNPKTVGALKGKADTDNVSKGDESQYASLLRQFTDQMVSRGFSIEPGNVFASHPSTREKIGGRVYASMDLVDNEVQVIVWKDNLQGVRDSRRVFNGFDAAADALGLVDQLMGQSRSQNLLDLQSGKFDSLDPLAFLGKLKEIADELNDIEPLKGPAIAYIEKNSERVSAVMESAMQEAFGKLWGATA